MSKMCVCVYSMCVCEGVSTDKGNLYAVQFNSYNLNFRSKYLSNQVWYVQPFIIIIIIITSNSFQ